jgi:hypothetical protein
MRRVEFPLAYGSEYTLNIPWTRYYMIWAGMGYMRYWAYIGTTWELYGNHQKSHNQPKIGKWTLSAYCTTTDNHSSKAYPIHYLKL